MGRRARGEGTTYKRPDKRPASRWAAEIKVKLPDGRRKRVTGYGATQEEALAERKRKVGEAMASTPTRRMTLDQYLAYWLDQRAAEVKANMLSIRTYEAYDSDIRINIKPYLGSYPLELIKPHHVQEWISTLLTTPVDTPGGKRKKLKSPAVVRKARATLHTAFESAVDWDILDRNPIPKRSQISERTPEIEVWTEEAVEAFLRAASDHRLYALFYLAIVTGMRQGELFGLRWQDIDLDNKMIHIRKGLKCVKKRHLDLARQNPKLAHLTGPYFLGNPKTPKSRRHIVIATDVIRVLAAHYETQQGERKFAGSAYRDFDLVFCTTTGTPLSQTNVRQRDFLPLAKKAGLPASRFHDQRDLSASLLIARGVDIATVSERLGHSRTSTTWDKYVRVVKSARERSVMTMEELLKKQ